jgi:hypothetical protein
MVVHVSCFETTVSSPARRVVRPLELLTNWPTADADATSGRSWGHEEQMGDRLVLEILTVLNTLGWTLETSFQTNNEHEDQDTLFFRQTSTPERAPIRTFCAITFHNNDRIRLLDWHSEDVHNAFMAGVRVGLSRFPFDSFWLPL